LTPAPSAWLYLAQLIEALDLKHIPIFGFSTGIGRRHGTSRSARPA
jgi:hypothetical protein